MVLKHLPAAVGAKMHEDYRAISNIYGRIRNVFHPRPEAIGTEA